MDNENKELQNSPTEAELEEKVRQDVSEKIRDAAAELEEEIAEADAAAEEVSEVEESEPVIIGYDEEGNPIYAEEEEAEAVIVGYDEEGNPIYAEEEEVEVKEPKKVTIGLTNLILSLVGAALIGAILLFAGSKVPEWYASAGSSVAPATPLFQGGAKVAKVEGVAITQSDMERYIYQAATEYISTSGGVVSDPAEFDWSTEVEDGKTAEQVVKENALKLAIENVLLMKAGKESGVEWDEEMETTRVDMEIQQLTQTYGEELVELNALAQGFSDMDHFRRMMIRDSYSQAIAADMTANRDSYYPDNETLTEFASTDGVTVKHILVAREQEEAPAEGEAAPAEGEAAPAEGEAAPAEGEAAEAPIDKKLLAEEILKKVQEGADFDALVTEFNEDPGMTEAGYVVTKTSSFVPEFKEAALALGMNEVSGIVETEHGYHIIKRIPGEIDLFNYWRSDAKVKTNQKKLDEISVADVVAKVSGSRESFQSKMQAYQAENPAPTASGGAY